MRKQNEFIFNSMQSHMGFPGGLVVEKPLAKQEMWVLHLEHPLEKEMENAVPWRTTPVFFPGRSHGQKIQMCCSPGCHKELDATQRLNTTTNVTYIFVKSCFSIGLRAALPLEPLNLVPYKIEGSVFTLQQKNGADLVS